MWPKIGPVESYLILYLTAIAVHFGLSWRIAVRLELERRVWLSASISYLVGMTIGAKILYDVHRWQLDFGDIFTFNYYLTGGLWGGLLAYFGLAVPFVLWLAQQKRAAVDLVARALPLPYLLAKAGCFLQGCCWGRSCEYPWAITFSEENISAPTGVPLHPTQIYEMALMGTMLVLFKLLDHDRWRGTFLLWFLAVFGVGRAAIEIFKDDTERLVYLGPITLLQLLLLATALCATLLLVVYKLKALSEVKELKGAGVKGVKSL